MERFTFSHPTSWVDFWQNSGSAWRSNLGLRQGPGKHRYVAPSSKELPPSGFCGVFRFLDFGFHFLVPFCGGLHVGLVDAICRFRKSVKHPNLVIELDTVDGPIGRATIPNQFDGAVSNACTHILGHGERILSFLDGMKIEAELLLHIFRQCQVAVERGSIDEFEHLLSHLPLRRPLPPRSNTTHSWIDRCSAMRRARWLTSIPSWDGVDIRQISTHRIIKSKADIDPPLFTSHLVDVGLGSIPSAFSKAAGS